LKRLIAHRIIDILESPPVREAWIETLHPVGLLTDIESPPVREAWIETGRIEPRRRCRHVASRAGGVD